jgi:hypothetical protein
MDDELAGRILCRLALVHSALGRRAYERAAYNALVGIGRVVHEEAEKRAGIRLRGRSSKVLRFPGPHKMRSDDVDRP